MRSMGNGFKLANRVRELRRRLKLRQADLAAEVDVTRQTIIAIEKGKLNPSIFICLKIARVLREPVDYVFFLDRAACSDTTAIPRADHNDAAMTTAIKYRGSGYVLRTARTHWTSA